MKVMEMRLGGDGRRSVYCVRECLNCRTGWMLEVDL